MFTAEIFNESYNPAYNPFTLTVQHFGAEAEGGYDTTEITVTGDVRELKILRNWLRYYVVIRNQHHSAMWAGIVTTASYPAGSKLISYGLDDMANRIAVAYSQEDADGNTINGVTAYTDDLVSQARYGIKELLKSGGELDEALALGQRDEALRAKANPVRSVELYSGGSTGSPTEPEGRLLCRGIADTFSWRLFNQPGGVVRHEEIGNFEHLLGWGVVGSQLVAFNNQGGEARIHRLAGALEALRTDDVVIVANAANGANNGTFTVSQAVSGDPESYTASTLSGDPSDDIQDTAGGLGFVRSHELLLASGFTVAGNNRYYFAGDETAANHITVRPATVATDAADSAVTIQQGHSVTVTATTLVQEFPGNAIDITALGVAVAQSFTLAVNTPFVVAEVWVRLKRVGSPTDSVRATIYTDNAGSPSGTTLETVAMLGSGVSDKNLVWFKFVFTTSPGLTFGATYWLGMERTGAYSPTDYYVLDLDEDAGYASGLVKLWNGASWVSRTVPADMPFQIWAKRQTSDQITDIYNATNQFCSALDIQVATGRYSRMYRDSDLDARQELEKLTQAGVLNGRRLLYRVSPDRVLHVYEEPVYSADRSMIFTDEGEFVDLLGQPADQGYLPSGEWVTLAGELPDEAGEFVEKIGYDAAQDRYTDPVLKGDVDPFDVIG